MDVKQTWKQHYSVVPGQLERMKQVSGVASVFNANIDAVLKVKPEMMLKWIEVLGLGEPQVLGAGPKRIDEPADVLRGFLECFSKGIAQEWLVGSAETFIWMQEHLGQDHLQMGGQGGIIANVMAVAGVQNVYVHCASHPSSQAALFLDRANLLAPDSNGRLIRAHEVNRASDLPLIHWILEFDKDAELTIGGTTFKCPKSNRFIATYDPLNFVLHVDEGFDRAMREPSHPLDVILLSGYQMLSRTLPGGRPGVERIEDSWKQIEAWKKAHPGAIVHFEFASTQDPEIRKALAEQLAPKADSVGCNEQEEIQILDVLGEAALARDCAALDSVSLFKGLARIFDRIRPGRIQLHMFGLYLTLARPDFATPSLRIRDGMVLAATLAAAKAGAGSLERAENLLWAHGRDVSDHSLKELNALAAYVKQTFGKDGLDQTGIVETDDFRLIAAPTILIEKPVTLVGMGDTISSLSLVGSRS